MQHLAKQILEVAAIVIGGYVAFIAVVVLTLHVIDWVKDGGVRRLKLW